MNSLPCNKDLASSQGFDIVILYDSYKSSLPQRSGFKPARILMSVFNQTYEQSSYIKDLASSQGYGVRLLYDSNKSSLSQRSGFKPGF